MSAWKLLLLYGLDWALIAISFFNTVALLWLGLTVLLNADRRAWGTWVSGGGMLLGALAFAGHTAIVGRPIGSYGGEVEFYWRASWLPVVAAPFLWYLGALWYSGVLGTTRQRLTLACVALLGLLLLAQLASPSALPSVREVLRMASRPLPSLVGVPLLALLAPAYSLLCILLALEVLRRPAASQRFMGDQARARARPWFVAASLVLLLVGLLFGLGMGWFLTVATTRPSASFFARAFLLYLLGDLLLSTLVALAIILVGQAVVTYEVFTGKALPRGQLRRDWRRVLVLAAGFGALVGLSLELPLDPIYRLLLATLLMTVFYALQNWRSYREHDLNLARLRPFVASQHLYEQLLQGSPTDQATTAPFRALADDLLGATLAYLVPLGTLASLAGPTLRYSCAGATVGLAAPPDISELAGQLSSPATLCVAVEPEQVGGARWAVPLWGERGLSGVLLLGDKRDGGIYTREEIATAQAAGERLLDMRAGAEMARRLMDLQRQRLAESRVIDQRARRTLHDDVLPRLHAALLQLSGEGERQHETVALLSDVHRQVAALLRAMPVVASSGLAVHGLLDALRQLVQGELAGAFDQVRWQVSPEAENAARELSPIAAEVAFGAAREAMRNAARHGRGGDERRPLRLLIVGRVAYGLELLIEDDGVGIASVTATTGSGQGIALHSTMLAVIGGTLTVEAGAGRPTRVTLALPVA